MVMVMVGRSKEDIFFFFIPKDVLGLIIGSHYAEDSGNLLDLGHDTIYPETAVHGLRSIEEVMKFVSLRIQATVNVNFHL